MLQRVELTEAASEPLEVLGIKVGAIQDTRGRVWLEVESLAAWLLTKRGLQAAELVQLLGEETKVRFARELGTDGWLTPCPRSPPMAEMTDERLAELKALAHVPEWDEDISPGTLLELTDEIDRLRAELRCPTCDQEGRIDYCLDCVMSGRFRGTPEPPNG